MTEEFNKEAVVEAALVNGAASDAAITNGTEAPGVIPTEKSEAETEKRISAAVAKMTENTERARRAAERLTEEEESVGEYKRRLAEENIRKAELERKKRREEEALAERQRALLRAEEKEEYVRLRNEENGARFRRSEELFGFIKGRIDAKRAEENPSEETEASALSEALSDGVQSQETATAESVSADITEKSEQIREPETTVTDDLLPEAEFSEPKESSVSEEEFSEPKESSVGGDANFDGESSADEKIIISFGASDFRKEPPAIVKEEDGVIHITPYGEGGVYAHPYVFSEGRTQEQNHPFIPADAAPSLSGGQRRRFFKEETGERENYGIYEPDCTYPDTDDDLSLGEYESLYDAYEPEGAYDTEGSGARVDSEAAARYQSEVEAANRDFAAIEEEKLSGSHGELEAFARSQLPKRLDAFYKRESALCKEIMKLEAQQKNASPEENISLIVEKVARKKELCELSAEALGACVHVRARSRIAKHRKILEGHVSDYNSLCDEYENNTGRPVERIGEDMVNDVLSERVCRPIQNLRYYGVEDEYATGIMDAETDRMQRLDEEAELVRREYDRYVEGGCRTELTPDEERIAKRRRAERMSAIRRAAERDSILIGLRTEYRIAALEARRDMLMSAYATDRKKSLREKRDVSRAITKIKRKAAGEARRAREANARYYLLPAISPDGEKVRKRARRERLESLRLRLDVLLAERESINERLIALYGGADKKLKNAKIRRKASAVRRKSAKAMYKKQRGIAKKIDSCRAPLDMKERAYELLNKKTAAVALADESRYKLRRMKLSGRAEKELIANIKRSKKTVKQTDKELKYVMKKLRRQEEHYRDEREWRFFLAVFAILLALGVGAWILYGDKITAYLKYLVEWFSSLR